MQKLFRWLAISLLAFGGLYLVAAVQGAIQRRPWPSPMAAEAIERRTLSFAANSRAASATSAGRSLLQGWAGGGDPLLTAVQRGVRAALFLWVSLINLLAVSTMWAVAADTFSSDAGEAVFDLRCTSCWAAALPLRLLCSVFLLQSHSSSRCIAQCPRIRGN